MRRVSVNNGTMLDETPLMNLCHRFGKVRWPLGSFRTLLRSSPILVVVYGCSGLFAQIPTPQGGTIHGFVKSANLPIPGVTVTAANSLTGQKTVTSTDADGGYSLSMVSDGRYVVRTQ